METQEKTAFLKSLAENMDGFSVDIPARGSARLRRADGLMISMYVDRYRKRTEWTFCLQNEDYRVEEGHGPCAFINPLSYGEKTPSIGANHARGPKAVAKAIQSRLLPQCEPLHARALETVARSKQHDQSVADLAGQLGLDADVDGQARFRVDGARCGATVTPDRVTLELDLSPEKAAAVLALLRD